MLNEINLGRNKASRAAAAAGKEWQELVPPPPSTNEMNEWRPGWQGKNRSCVIRSDPAIDLLLQFKNAGMCAWARRPKRGRRRRRRRMGSLSTESAGLPRHAAEGLIRVVVRCRLMAWRVSGREDEREINLGHVMILFFLFSFSLPLSLVVSDVWCGRKVHKSPWLGLPRKNWHLKWITFRYSIGIWLRNESINIGSWHLEGWKVKCVRKYNIDVGKVS